MNRNLNHFADFSQRLLAYNLDLTVLLLLLFPLSFLISIDWIYYALCFVIVCIYHSVLERTSWHATVGKHYTQMKVVDYKTKEGISMGRALLRILAKFLSLAPCFAGFFLIYFRADRRALHDLIAGTCVIRFSKLKTKDPITKGNKM
ncbi:RDD family protein [Reichenbachiella ulvae]|uniref:RDD family protein n=1 Tax=Reichenbachiella ulvae TaxID=2980104 RepID=UPI003850D0A7